MDACLRELRGRKIELLVSFFSTDDQAPFSRDQFMWLHTDCRALEWRNTKSIDRRRLVADLDDFRPDLLVVSGWNHSGYRVAARHFRNRAVRLLCMDNPWDETLKQWVGRLIAPLYVRPLFDGAFVPGERQFQFARRLWFADGEISTGCFAPDTARFTPLQIGGERHSLGFLCVGRLAEEKGTRVLIDAYLRYRQLSASPWRLSVAGTGPLKGLLEGIAGIDDMGFVQQDAMPALMQRQACLVVPSLWDHWGVQISEAATAGLPIIATTTCGAAVHLVRDGCNGYVVPPGDAVALARAMLRMETSQRREEFCENSLALSRQFTPRIWADNLLSHPAICSAQFEEVSGGRNRSATT
jgi:glycosyltransferase involved in cell wall biosynthesis